MAPVATLLNIKVHERIEEEEKEESSKLLQC